MVFNEMILMTELFTNPFIDCAYRAHGSSEETVCKYTACGFLHTLFHSNNELGILQVFSSDLSTPGSACFRLACKSLGFLMVLFLNCIHLGQVGGVALTKGLVDAIEERYNASFNDVHVWQNICLFAIYVENML